MTPEQREKFIGELEERMREAARKFEFEQAAQLRDKVKALKIDPVLGARRRSPEPARRSSPR